MKKYFCIALAAIAMMSCTNEELENPDLSTTTLNSKAASGTKANPIVLPLGTPVEYNVYHRPNCDPNGTPKTIWATYHGGKFYRSYVNSTGIRAYEYYDLDESGNCFSLSNERGPGNSGLIEFGKYYEVDGELIKVTAPPATNSHNREFFFYKEVPNSNKIRRITLRNNFLGIYKTGKPINYPYSTFDCNRVDPDGDGRFRRFSSRYRIFDNGAVYKEKPLNIYTTILEFQGRCR